MYEQTFTNIESEPERTKSSPRSWLAALRSSFDRHLLLFNLFYFAFFGAFGSLFPLISVYFKQLGLSAIQCGLLSGVRSLAECLASPFWGALAEKWKKGKAFLLLALACSMAFTLGLGFIRPSPSGCLVSLTQPINDLNTSTGLALTLVEPYRASRYDALQSVDMDRDLAVNARNEIGQSPLLLDTSKLIAVNRSQEARRWLHSVGRRVVGSQRLFVNPSEYASGSLVVPLYSTVVYSQNKINQIWVLLFLLVLFGELLACPIVPLTEYALVQARGQALEVDPLFGRQRMFGSIGWSLAMFFIGITLDHSNTFPDYPCLTPGYRERNYTVCFTSYAVFMALALFIATQFSFRYEGGKESMYFKLVKDKMAKTFLGRVTKNRSKLANQPSGDDDQWREEILARQQQSQQESDDFPIRHTNDQPSAQSEVDAMAAEQIENPDLMTITQLKITRWAKAMRQFRQPQLFAFLFVTWFMGVGVGQVFTFLFWHVQEIDGSPTLFGIATVINHVSEVVMFFFSATLIDKLGHHKILYIGLITNVARFLYVSWIRNPWWILPFEFVQGFTHAGVWMACCCYVMQAFSPELQATSKGFLQAVHYGLGRASGSIIGGLVISKYGSATMFRSYGVASAFVLIAFLLLNYFLPSSTDTPAEENRTAVDPTVNFYGQSDVQPYHLPSQKSISATEEEIHDYYKQQAI